MVQLWRKQNGAVTSVPMNGPIGLVVGSRSPLLVPVDGKPGLVGALLVPDAWDRVVARNGRPLAAGLHRVGHTDRLDVNGETYWVAASAELRSEAYVPEVHGEDAYCFITKARLDAGQQIIVCPGRPGGACGILYKQEAWEMAVAGNANFRCPQCGFDPAAGQWQPTVRPQNSLKRLFALAEQHTAQGIRQ